MFNPSLAGIEDSGFHHKIADAINTCEMDHFLPLIQNIILTGGTTMFPGLSTRLDRELSQLFTETKYKGDEKRIKKTGMLIHDPPRRKHAVFIGASFLASSAPDETWISRSAYEE